MEACRQTLCQRKDEILRHLLLRDLLCGQNCVQHLCAGKFQFLLVQLIELSGPGSHIEKRDFRTSCARMLYALVLALVLLSFIQVEQAQKRRRRAISEDAPEFELGDLKKYTTYTVQLAAYTVSAGVLSPGMNITTAEDGMSRSKGHAVECHVAKSG